MKARAWIRPVVAVGGLAAVLVVLALLPPFGQPVPRWGWRFFILWCLVVPYWHFAEYCWLLDPAADERQRRRFLALQALSRTVWAGVALVLAVALLAGAWRQ